MLELPKTAHNNSIKTYRESLRKKSNQSEGSVTASLFRILFVYIGCSTLIQLGYSYYAFNFLNDPIPTLSMWGEQYTTPIPVPPDHHMLLIGFTAEKFSKIDHISISFNPTDEFTLTDNPNKRLVKDISYDPDFIESLNYSYPIYASPDSSFILGFRYQAQKSKTPFRLRIGYSAQVLDRGTSFLSSIYPPQPRTYTKDFFFIPSGQLAFTDEGEFARTHLFMRRHSIDKKIGIGGEATSVPINLRIQKCGCKIPSSDFYIHETRLPETPMILRTPQLVPSKH